MQCSITFSSSNGVHYFPTTTILGMCLLCGPKATYLSSLADKKSSSSWHQICGGWFIGVCSKVSSFRGSHGAFIKPSWWIHGWFASAWQLATLQLGSFVSFKILYIRQLDSLQIVNLHAGSLTYCSSAVWQLGSSAAWQLGSFTFGSLGTFATRQLRTLHASI